MWQNFFDKPKKHYNPYMERMKEYPFYIHWDKELINNTKGKWNEFFGNNNDIYLEIGSGQGNFTVGNALKYRDRNFIGIELKFKRLHMSAVKANKRSLKNITLISESGFLEKKDLDFAIEMNVSGVLVGEALMKGKIYGE